MELQFSFTGKYRLYTNMGFHTIKEIINLFQCDDFYIVMRITRICNSDDIIPIETKQFTSISKAHELYHKWYIELTSKMTTSNTHD